LDFKQAIIENAWGGFSVDYGLLHLQLATPFAVMIVLFIMIYALNKLLFQPVLRTLDNRTDAIAKSEQSVIQVSEEVESLKQDFQKQLDALRTEALHLKNTGHEEGLAERESMILKERQTLENEIEKSISELEGEINSTKKIFSKLNKELSASIRKQFIN
tara:strand:- start:263 stop:742 length:480 start_codon:yes stop_codon:yes gene_type:complete